MSHWNIFSTAKSSLYFPSNTYLYLFYYVNYFTSIITTISKFCILFFICFTFIDLSGIEIFESLVRQWSVQNTLNCSEYATANSPFHRKSMFDEMPECVYFLWKNWKCSPTLKQDIVLPPWEDESIPQTGRQEPCSKLNSCNLTHEIPGEGD